MYCKNSISLILFDWGNTLMRDIPGMSGPMAHWPEVEAMPGAFNLLQNLRSRYRLCLASNAGDSDAELIRQALARVGLADFFEKILTSKELETLKPDPEFFKRAMIQLNCNPGEALTVGDNLDKDIVPAKSVGIQTCWVTHRENDSDDADFKVRSPTELITVL